MKVVVIGGVAAGTKFAAKFKRENRAAQVKLLTKGSDISYAGCGLPYYVGGMIESRDELIVNSPKAYSDLTGVEVVTECEVTSVDVAGHSVSAIKDNHVFTESYDKLVIATGASPFVPDIPGKDLKNVFTVRTPEDAVAIRECAVRNDKNNFVVVGAGFIGLEVAENLKAQGKNVTVIDFASQIMPNAFDSEMAWYAKKHLMSQGIGVLTGTGIVSIEGGDGASGDEAVSVTTTTGSLKADGVVLAIGVRPNTAFLNDTGIEMVKGAIVVDDKMKTNLDDVYAAGDCAFVQNRITGKRIWSARGSTANITGRILAKNLGGISRESTCQGGGYAYQGGEADCQRKEFSYSGAMGTGVVKLSNSLNAGRTGLTEVQAKAEGIDVETVIAVTDDKAHYYGDSSTFITKLIAERSTHKILGIQVLGSGAVDKMTDIAVVAISMGLKLEDIDDMDFAYAPPFSTAIHPFVQACYILENKLNGELNSITPLQFHQGAAKDYKIIDMSLGGQKIPGAKWYELEKIGPSGINGVDKDEKLLLVCAKGKRAYFTQNRLKAAGYTNTLVLEGGLAFNEVKVDFGSVIPADEVKRVKGLGCLQDKTQPDHFNVRVITRNGKITTEEHRAIAEAAEKFGSGEIAMTTRLTMEIQGVPFGKIDELIEFLGRYGLMTGGTGSKVRPVVSCKGTTCQYGLIDTFCLSEKIHDMFYVGYHDVSLPHKFKIAVGGCPNNCVKPDLNDLGIIGQRVPLFDMNKCKGCKNCQVENICPIKIAHVENGKLAVNPEECNHCGRCIAKCPFGVTTEYTDGYRIYVGGRWGKKWAHGRMLNKVLTSEEEVLNVVENAILLFRDEGISGERFADTVTRLGLEYVQDKILNNKIDKAKIMKKKVIGGATC